MRLTIEIGRNKSQPQKQSVQILNSLLRDTHKEDKSYTMLRSYFQSLLRSGSARLSFLGIHVCSPSSPLLSRQMLTRNSVSHFPVPNVDASKTKIFCNVGDNICDNGDLILAPHLLYGTNAVEAATFATS